MIWVYGGAFNPPTVAHQHIISHIKNMYPQDTVIIVPVGNDYQKSTLIDFSHRYHMCQLAFKEVEISTYEQDHPFKGTYTLLQQLQQEKHERVGFIIGADQLDQFHTWIEYQKLMQEHHCLIISRQGVIETQQQELLDQFKHYTWIQLDIPISSTYIRNNVESSKPHVDSSVYDYIKKHELYKE